jgi:hypothetical protein
VGEAAEQLGQPEAEDQAVESDEVGERVHSAPWPFPGACQMDGVGARRPSLPVGGDALDWAEP